MREATGDPLWLFTSVRRSFQPSPGGSFVQSPILRRIRLYSEGPTAAAPSLHVFAEISLPDMALERCATCVWDYL